jgi:hypothetical protein
MPIIVPRAAVLTRLPNGSKRFCRCIQGHHAIGIERRCRITGVDNPIHLVASHCKPWRDSTNEERLTGENGLLLTRSIDHLFDRDRGFIGFEDSGRLVISPVGHLPSEDRTSLLKCFSLIAL